MADNENGFLLKRISELERLNSETAAEAKKRRLQVKALNKELADLKLEREQMAHNLDVLQKSPGEWQAKAESLQKDLRLRDHRDAWMKVIGENLNEKVPLEEVWGKIKYQPGDEVPSESEIKNQEKAAREAAPYLFRQETEPAKPAPNGAQPHQKPAQQVPFDASRGERDTGPQRFVVRTSDMRNSEFMMANSKRIAEASRQGSLTILPD